MPFELPCGCRSCGCLCASHSPTGSEDPCPNCDALGTVLWVLTDLCALGALVLFIVALGGWAAIVAGA